MSKINSEKIWEFVINKIHSVKPSKKNLIEKEMLFATQILLGQYELAKKEKNNEVMKFCADVLEIYEKHGINGHIVWNK